MREAAPRRPGRPGGKRTDEQGPLDRAADPGSRDARAGIRQARHDHVGGHQRVHRERPREGRVPRRHHLGPARRHLRPVPRQGLHGGDRGPAPDAPVGRRGRQAALEDRGRRGVARDALRAQEEGLRGRCAGRPGQRDDDEPADGTADGAEAASSGPATPRPKSWRWRSPDARATCGGRRPPWRPPHPRAPAQAVARSPSRARTRRRRRLPTRRRPRSARSTISGARRTRRPGSRRR